MSWVEGHLFRKGEKLCRVRLFNVGEGVDCLM